MLYCDFKKKYGTTSNIFTLNIKAELKLNAVNAIFGVSGSGKTSFLRVLSGLDIIDTGCIKTKEQVWINTENNLGLNPSKIKIAFVQQENNLFKNMTVLKNIQFACKNYDHLYFDEIISVLEVQRLLPKKPRQLSKGEAQRAGLAVALIQKPDYLFLDETLSALDEVLRKKIQFFLISIQKKMNFTLVLISHQLSEVLLMANHVVVIKNGSVTAQGTTDLLLNNTSNYLKGLVVKINQNHTTLLVGEQKIILPKQKIINPFFNLGDVVEFKP